MGATTFVPVLPPCNFCRGEVREARYDFKTKHGSWAYGCEVHYLARRAFPDLGTGKGQRLLTDREDPSVCHECGIVKAFSVEDGSNGEPIERYDHGPEPTDCPQAKPFPWAQS